MTMKIDVGYSLQRAVGPSARECAFLATRFDAESGPEEDTSDCWALRSRQGRVTPLWGTTHTLSGLWRATTGSVYVGERRGVVRVFPPESERGEGAVEHSLPPFLNGLWGLADDAVFAFGGASGSHPAVGSYGLPWVWRWDGAAWHPLPPPPGALFAMDGTRPDMILGVGARGLIARWDGAAWSTFAPPIANAVTSVSVVDDDAMYACGDGVLLEGSVYGWAPIALDADAMPQEVLACHGSVWVATDLELATLSGRQLTVVTPGARNATLSSTSDGILFTEHDRVVETRDGKTLRGVGLRRVADALRETAPLWSEVAGTEGWRDAPKYTNRIFNIHGPWEEV